MWELANYVYMPVEEGIYSKTTWSANDNIGSHFSLGLDVDLAWISWKAWVEIVGENLEFNFLLVFASEIYENE